MSPVSTTTTCPLCHVRVIGSVCPVCRTALVSPLPNLTARVLSVTKAKQLDSRLAQPAKLRTIVPNSRDEIEGTVIKELPSAEWRRRDPWAIVSGLLLFIVVLPLIAVVGLIITALLFLLMVFGMRLLGLSMIGSFFALPFMLFRRNQRQPRQARHFIVQTSEGNRRVAQIGEWNSYLYEGCRVRLRGKERKGLLIVESGEDLDNRYATLARHDRQLPWAAIAVVLAIILLVEYAYFIAEAGL